MKIITISLRQSTTIIGKIEKKKKNFKVDDIVTYKPMLPLVTENKVTELKEKIRYIAENMNGKDAVFYATLPTSTYRQDYLLSSVRSAEQDRMIAWLDNNFQKDFKMNYAIGITMVQRYEKSIYVTAAGTKKEYIDCLQKAFSENDLDLAAVEAESAAYVRSVGRWDANYLIVDVDEQTTNVIAYCSKIGMYTTTIPIGAKALQENEERANDLVNEVLLCDAAWEFPVDTPRQIYVVGDSQKRILHLLRGKRDLVFEINLPYFKNTDAFPNRELLILPVGTAYREYYGGTIHANTNHELSASIGGGGTRLPNVKEKVKQIFKIDRYRSFFRHRG